MYTSNWRVKKNSINHTINRLQLERFESSSKIWTMKRLGLPTLFIISVLFYIKKKGKSSTRTYLHLHDLIRFPISPPSQSSFLKFSDISWNVMKMRMHDTYYLFPSVLSLHPIEVNKKPSISLKYERLPKII